MDERSSIRVELPAMDPLTEAASAGVALVSIDRPDVLNAIDRSTIMELVRTLETLDAEPDCRCIVITGAGERAFAAGADIAEMAQLTGDSLRADDPFATWDRIGDIVTPTIAAVRGFALGGGFELVLACDLVVAADDATFGQPEIRLGIMPGVGGTQRLTRAIGKARAMELILTGRRLPAAEAHAMGLVSRLVPAAETLPAALALATEIAAGPPLAVAAATRAIDAAFELSLADGLRAERAAFHDLFDTDDQSEGMRAFLGEATAGLARSVTVRAVVVGEGPAADAVAAALHGGSDPVEVVRVADPMRADADLSATDLVVEAAPDAPLERKVAAVAALLRESPPSVTIAVLTRFHLLDELLPSRCEGGRVVGLRLVPGTPVAEVAMPAVFDGAVVDAVLDLLAGAGLVALPCGDAPGRIVDRMVAAVALDLRWLVEGGVSVAVATESLTRAGLSLAAVETDDLPPIAAALHAGLGDAPRFTFTAPGDRVIGAVAAGQPFAGGAVPPGVEAVAARLELVAIAEAYRLVGEAVAGAEEIERAMTTGARWSAGPFTMAGRRGLRTVVTGLAGLSRVSDVDPVTADRFGIPQLLWQMATV